MSQKSSLNNFKICNTWHVNHFDIIFYQNFSKIQLFHRIIFIYSLYIRVYSRKLGYACDFLENDKKRANKCLKWQKRANYLKIWAKIYETGKKRGRCLRINYNKLAINYQKSSCTLYDYTLFRHGHLDNVKGGGFCNYHKSYLPLRVLDILRLNECLIFEVKLNGKSVILSTLYRSPSPFQFTDEFDNFLSKFEDNLFSIISKKPFTCFF